MLQDGRLAKDPSLQLICAVQYKAVLRMFWQAARLSPKFSPANHHAYDIRVSLDDIKPEIWRTLRVSGAIRLSLLHDALQIVMGWQNCHLHSFHLDGIEFGMNLEEEGVDELAFLDETEFRLEELAHGQAMTLQYQYDFGDSWQHTVDIRAAGESLDLKTRPVCTGGERACPPEDCGGAHGYVELLQTLADPANPEFDDMWDWAGRDFEPERFDAAKVNRRLKRRFK